MQCTKNNNYDDDFFGWITEKESLLKYKESEKLDIKNLIDEIENLRRIIDSEIET